MSRTYALLVALSTALASLFAPQHESAGRGPKALVYCPASDISGCTAVVNALASAFPGGVDRGYDGSNGTVDLAKVDLMQYSVLVVPSLADRDGAKPYALLRDQAVAGRLKETFIGRVAFWSGTPDLGQANRADKDALIRNLAGWAASNRATLFRRGLVVLQDLSEDVAKRYDWVPAIARVNVTADAAVRVYGSVSTPTAVGQTILDNGGTPLAFENMAAFGLRVATGTIASLDATGEDGAGAALVTVAPDVSRAPKFAAGVVSTNGATTGPSITTDKDDYAPGTIVTITGSGWGANEVVHLNLVESPTADGPHDWDVTADGSGNFTDQSFSPGPQHVGVTFTLTATGSSGSTAQTTFSDSNPQTLTVGSPAPASINAGGSMAYAVTVAVGGNSNPCTVTFSISPSTPLPTGATASFTNNPVTTTGTNISSTLTISTTAATPPGSYPFTVQGTNSGSGCQGPGNLTGGQTLVVQGAANSPPVLAPIGAKSTPELQALTFTISASDADAGQALTYAATGLPTGASFDAATRTFSWTPTEAQGPGSFPVTFTVADNGAPIRADTETVTITVTEVNLAPVLAAIADQNASEGTPFSVTAAATDADIPANAIAYSLLNAPSGMTINGTSGLITWTPDETQGGNVYNLQVVATDNGAPAMADTADVKVTVAEVNVAPVLSGVPASATIPELAAYTFDANASDADLPAQTLTFSLVGAPAGAAIDASTGVFTWTPTEAQGPGVYTFKVQVTDGVTPTEQQVVLTVNEVNTAPVLAPIGDQTVDELTALTFTASATDADLPAQALTYALVGAPAGASIDASTGAFSWTPTEAQGPGSYPFKVTVTDNGSPIQADTEQITVTVKEVNAPPVWTTIGNMTVDEETLLEFTVSASDSDLPANTLTYSVVGSLPTGATFDAATRKFSWTPTEAQGPGSYPVTLRVSDGTANVDESFTITVNEVNQAPVLAPIGNKTTDEEVALTFTALATDPDLPPNAVTFSLVGAPAGASINASTGAFSWTPSEAQGPGTYTFKVKVTDNGSPALSDDEDITVTVNEVNKAPTLDPIANGSVDEGSTFTTTAVAHDPDLPDNTLTFSIVSGPSGASINAVTGVLTWTPADDDPTGTPSDQYTIKVRVTDNGTPAMFDDESFVVTVNNVAPTLVTSTVDPLLTPIPVGSPVKVNATFTDPGTDTYTLKVTWDTGMQPENFPNYTSETIISKTNLPAGVYTITMQIVDDDTGASAAQTQTMYVVIYDPSAGFVTGGGWIDSPTGACLLSTCTVNTTGKATFGLVAKYQKGQSTPSGNTEFQFHAGNLNFKATLYQWLVVAGTKAQYKGEGTINGSGRYGFLITAIDGDSKNTGQDQFRIKIWNYATSAVVYDNKMGSSEDSSDATALGGGSINIQAK